VLSPLVFRKISERFPRKARAAKDYGARSDSHSTTGGSYRLGRAQIETDQINDVQKQAAAGFYAALLLSALEIILTGRGSEIFMRVPQTEQ
jgi:hypothetical protein